MNEIYLVALIFAVLLGVEWRYRLTSVRLGTATLALVVLMLASPPLTPTTRRVRVAPPQERITELHGLQLSEYESGVLTLSQAVGEVEMMHADVRLLVLTVLFWLACSPALRRRQTSRTQQIHDLN